MRLLGNVNKPVLPAAHWPLIEPVAEQLADGAPSVPRQVHAHGPGLLALPCVNTPNVLLGAHKSEELAGMAVIVELFDAQLPFAGTQLPCVLVVN